MTPLFIALIVFAAIVFVLLAWLMWRARSKPAAVRPPANSPGQSLWVRFRDRVRRCYAVVERAVRYLVARRDWRYNSSWLLLMGFPGDGKSSIVASLPETMQRASQRRDASQEAYLNSAAPNTHWKFLEKGILIDPDGVLGEPATGSTPGARWSELLADIDSLRPDRALDGVVWVISAERLKNASETERQALGRYAYARVHELQDAFAFAVPVYVVVSHCDTLQGFDAFWKAQPKGLQTQIVGWSSPTIEDNGLPSEWVPKLFTKVVESQRSLVLDAASSCDEIDDVDDFFLFPRHMRSLEAPLQAFLEALFKPNVYETRSFCRGVYFTGAIGAGKSAPLKGPRNDVSFIAGVIDDKALAEQRLAQRTQKGLLARNRLIRRLQLGLIGIGLVLAGALPWTAARINHHAQTLRDTLVNISVNSKALGKNSCLDGDRIYKLVSQISTLSESTRYLAIPLSWVDHRISNGVTEVVSNNALQHVILPSLACKLQQKIDALSATSLEASESLSSPDAVYANDQMQLKRQLSELAALEENLKRFANIAQPGMVEERQLLLDFGALANYVYRKPLPEDALKQDTPLAAALQQAVYDNPPTITDALRERLAKQFDGMGAQTQGDLLRHTGAGVALLSSLQEGKPPLLDTLRSFNGWLQWVRSSWLSSTPTDNPCTRMGAEITPGIDTLIRAHHYDANVLKNTLSRFGVEQCYQPAVDELRSASLPPYGGLFVVNPSNQQLEGVNPGLAREEAGLRALSNLGFMQVKSPQPYSCNGAAGGWQSGTFDQLLAQLREYQLFASQLKVSQTSASNDPLYDRLARMQLQLALQDTLARNQRGQVEPLDTGLDASSQLDRELSDESGALAAALDPLLQSQQRMRQLNLGAVADEVGQCAQNYGASMLLDVSSLASSSHLYDPGVQPGEDDTQPLFDLGATPVLQAYLDRQLQRVQVLARYAAPFVTLLKQTQGVNNSQRSNVQSDVYWGNTISELNRAVQFADPAGQVAHLNDFFLKQLGTLSYASCESTLGSYVSSALGNDLFSARREAMEKVARAACSGHGQSGADLHFMRIGMLFNSQLAGRYPFGKADQREVSPAVVKAFFVYYAKEKPELETWLASAKGAKATQMKNFIGQLDAVQAFFASNLSATPQSAPINLDIGFRALPGQSPLSNQLIAWTMLGGETQTAAWPGGGTAIAWNIGDALLLDLQWADRSRYTPVPDSAQPDLQVSGYHATFRASGSWALLRWLDAHGAQATAPSLDPNQHLVKFRIPVLDGSALADKGKGTPTVIADFYLTLKLSATDPATKAPVTLELPVFPQEAPILW
jgi:type VI secretion system protein ImpL